MFLSDTICDSHSLSVHISIPRPIYKFSADVSYSSVNDDTKLNGRACHCEPHNEHSCNYRLVLPSV